MKRMWNSISALLMLCMASASAQAAGDDEKITQGAGPAFFFSSDNENFDTQRVALEYLPKYSGNLDIMTSAALAAGEHLAVARLSRAA